MGAHKKVESGRLTPRRGQKRLREGFEAQIEELELLW